MGSLDSGSVGSLDSGSVGSVAGSGALAAAAAAAAGGARAARWAADLLLMLSKFPVREKGSVAARFSRGDGGFGATRSRASVGVVIEE